MVPYGHLESPRLQGWCGHGKQQQKHSLCVPGEQGLCLVSLPILQGQRWTQEGLIITVTST